MTPTLNKWKLIIEQIMMPYELEEELQEMLAEYLNKSLEPSPYATLSGRGMGTVIPPNPPTPWMPPTTQNEAVGIIKEFKERLSKDVDIRTDVKNIYYNGTIKRIVYELSNGDSIYIEGKPLVMKTPDYVEKSKRLFLSISDPTNPLLRRYKIEDIKKSL